MRNEHELAFGSRRIRLTVQRGKRARLRIVVAPDARVSVDAPAHATEADVLAAVRQRLPWIARHLDEVEQFHPLPMPTRYVSGETVLYLGRQYRLRIDPGPRKAPRLLGRFLELGVPRGTPRESVRRAVEAWYRRRAEDIFRRCLARWGEVTRRHGVPEPTWAVRTMTRRWGSCSPRGRITLNTRLVQAPLHCIEYVVVHELCHLKTPDHSKAFYSLLGRCLPDWQQRKDVLARLAV